MLSLPCSPGSDSGRPRRQLATKRATGLQVHCATAPVVELGEPFAADGKPWLQVCYLEHAYGLGQHYNSVASIGDALSIGGADDGGAD